MSHSHAFSSAVMTWVAVLCVAFALSYAPDFNTLRAGADPADDAVSDAIERSHAADTRLCQDLHGPESVAIQLPDGQHRCADKHGRRLSNRSAVTLARKVQP